MTIVGAVVVDLVVALPVDMAETTTTTLGVVERVAIGVVVTVADDVSFVVGMFVVGVAVLCTSVSADLELGDGGETGFDVIVEHSTGTSVIKTSPDCIV